MHQQLLLLFKVQQSCLKIKKVRRDSQLPELQEKMHIQLVVDKFFICSWRILQEQLQIQQVFQLLLLLKGGTTYSHAA